ncbi:hypothetical protein BDZ94DRAFT_1309777 [Collybia nuda]|uniref:Uncharacterized protein n=1 Tax=Collybia nuda TaxID=64659 RepID=A0A9P6CIY9_9AGAR|nr:hypothetical protein BDZ94DRAFT_1309777 [Collybia nuda]
MQMTDPDEQRERQDSRGNDLAARIPVTRMPSGLDRPRVHVRPIAPPLPDKPHRGRGRGHGQTTTPSTGNLAPRQPDFSLGNNNLQGFGQNLPRSQGQYQSHGQAAPPTTGDSLGNNNLLGFGQNLAQGQYHNLGLDNPASEPVNRHGRPCGPMHNITSGIADPALNNIHHGHIAHREQNANHRASRQAQIYQQQRQQKQDEFFDWLQGELCRIRETAAQQEAEHNRQMQEALIRQQTFDQWRQEYNADLDWIDGDNANIVNQDDPNFQSQEDQQFIAGQDAMPAQPFQPAQLQNPGADGADNGGDGDDDDPDDPDIPGGPAIPPAIPNHHLPVPTGQAPYQEPPVRHSLGPMNLICSKCGAKHFEDEK